MRHSIVTDHLSHVADGPRLRSPTSGPPAMQARSRHPSGTCDPLRRRLPTTCGQREPPVHPSAPARLQEVSHAPTEPDALRASDAPARPPATRRSASSVRPLARPPAMNARASPGRTPRHARPSWVAALSTQLYPRLDTRAVPERDPFATDVDGYFAHLTRALLDPTAFDGERRHLTRHDVDVLGRLHASCNGRVRYTLQRGPHDALVSSVAMFELPPAASGRRAMTRHAVDEPRMGRGPGYYQFTFGYAEPLATLRERIGGVLERLSLGYGKYLAILAH